MEELSEMNGKKYYVCEWNDSFKYKINDIENDELILQCIMYSKGKEGFRRGYIVRCLRDDFVFPILETSICYKNRCCPVCSKNKLIYGFNDVFTTRKDILEYFVDEEDAKTVTISSSKKILMKCPNCGTQKLIAMSNFNLFGFSCPCCSDGISFPNRFMYNILSYYNVDFDREFSPKWCVFDSFDKTYMERGIFDFVLPHSKTIIEMDGGLGHGNEIKNKNYKSKEESLYIDKQKDRLANENGYDVIRIDCNYEKTKERYSYIKSNILNSNLCHMISLNSSTIDSICEKTIKTNEFMSILNMWNSGLDVYEIKNNSLYKSITTINDKLLVASELGLCQFSSEISKKRTNKNKTGKYYTYSVEKDGNVTYFNNHYLLDEYLINNKFDITSKQIRTYLKNHKDKPFIHLGFIFKRYKNVG